MNKEKEIAWLMYKKGWSAGFKDGHDHLIGETNFEDFLEAYNEARVERVVKEMESVK